MSKLLREEMSKTEFVDTFTLRNYEKLAKTRIKYICKDIQKLRSLTHKDQKTTEYECDMQELKKQRAECNKYLNTILVSLANRQPEGFDPKREFSLILSAPVVDMEKYKGKTHRRQ